MEAASFQHYLVTGALITFEEAAAQLRALDPEGPGVRLTHEDYLLGIYDMTGEVMRFAITTMAVIGRLPGNADGRNVLNDLYDLRSALEGLEVGFGSRFARDVGSKMVVMQGTYGKHAMQSAAHQWQQRVFWCLSAFSHHLVCCHVKVDMVH